MLDALKSLKMIIFIVCILCLVFFASFITLYAQVKSEDRNTNPLFGITAYRYLQTGTYEKEYFYPIPPRYYYKEEPIPEGYVYDTKDKKLILKSSLTIDQLNEMIVPSEKFNIINVVFATITFSFIPYPFNIPVIILTWICGFIALWLLYKEIKSWIPFIES